MAKLAHIAVVAALWGGAATAQGFETLPEDQQVGYCATYYLSALAFEGRRASDGTRALADGFVDVAAEMTGQIADELRGNLEKGTVMLVPFFETVETNATARAMIETSAAFCAGLADAYEQTQGLEP